MRAAVAATPERRAALVTLVAGTLAVGVALIVPGFYSDPNGLDPYDLRLAGVALALVVLAHLWRRLERSRAVLLGLAAAVVSYSAWLWLPWVIWDLGGRISGPALTFWASLGEMVVTVVACVVAWRLRPELRPNLRLRRLGRRSVLVMIGGIAVVVIGGLMLPATWFGREGLQLVALAPGGSLDSVWLVPANLLQGAAQELQFRGLLMGALEKVMPSSAANVAQAVVFGLAHLAILYGGPVGPFVPLTVVAGWLFGEIARRCDSLWPAIVIHGIADVAITAVVIGGLYGL